MKSILKILVFLFSVSVFAQQPPRQMDSERGKRPNNRMQSMKALTPEQEATLWTKKMTLELDFLIEQLRPSLGSLGLLHLYWL